MRAIALLNQKGGSGKTTTAVNLGAALAEKGRRVLLVDFDPAAAASSWFGVRETGSDLLQVLTDGKALAELVKETSCKGLELVASSMLLAGADKALASEIGAETLLKRRIAKLPQDRWDYLLIDCPPSVGLLTLNALAAVKEVLIPVETHVLTLGGLVGLMQTIEVVKDRLNGELAIGGILACRVDRRTNHGLEVLDSLRKKFGGLMYATFIRENVTLAECPSFGESILQYSSSSPGAEDYRSLAKEVLAQENRN